MASGVKEFHGARSSYSKFFAPGFFAPGYTPVRRKLGLEPEIDSASPEFLPRIGSSEHRVDPSRLIFPFLIEPIFVRTPEDRVANDHELELEDLFEDYYDSVFYWFMRRGLERERAKELAQDTFLSAAKGWERFRREASYKTWLFQIARNAFRNDLRDRKTLKREGTTVSIDSGSETDDSESTPWELMDSSSISPEDEAIRQEKYRALYGSLGLLPTKIRQCLELRLLDMKYTEIAEVMGLSIETVKSHLHQGRSKLREHLDREPEGGR